MDVINDREYCARRYGCTYGKCPWNLIGVPKGVSSPKGYSEIRMRNGWFVLPADVKEAQRCELYKRL